MSSLGASVVRRVGALRLADLVRCVYAAAPQSSDPFHNYFPTRPPLDTFLNSISYRVWGAQNMLYLKRKPRSYGADDRPACPNCSRPTSLTRREPDGDYNLSFERQHFTCRACDHRIERVVDADGNPAEQSAKLGSQ
jgi:hypothetical protein